MTTMICDIDLPAKLRANLEAAGKDSYNVVAFTHADEDHIKGFSEFFYLEYAEKYQDDTRIKNRHSLGACSNHS